MPSLFCLGSSPSHSYARDYLMRTGFTIEEKPSAYTQGVLLDVPTSDLTVEAVFSDLSPGIQIFGGKFPFPIPSHLCTVDLLKDPGYTARNAQITARCAIRLACGELNTTLLRLPVLVIGWGRIGKCLAKLLHDLGADCVIYARRENNRAMLSALGYNAVDREEMLRFLPTAELVFNTAPDIVLDSKTADLCPGILIDLASSPGIISSRAIHARGLPGKMAPASSGQLIARTVIRLWKEEHP